MIRAASLGVILVLGVALGTCFTLDLKEKVHQENRQVWNRSPNWKPQPKVSRPQTQREKYESLAIYALEKKISNQAAFDAYVQSLKDS